MRQKAEARILAVVLFPLALAACGRTSEDQPGDAASGGQGQVSSGGATATGGAISSGGATATGGAISSGGSGGQDDGSGGQGSGGEPSNCPGAQPECEPGTQGCSERGETYQCTECGAIDLLGESCVRLLASDKEMGLVCSIRGETELLCVGGNLEWSELEFPIELPEFPSVFRLPDDTSSIGGPLNYCWINEGGSLGCGEGVTPPARSDCTDLALTDSSQFGNMSMCTLCAGQLDCQTASSDISVSGVVQAGITDHLSYWLTDEGSVLHEHIDGPVLPGSYSFIIMRDNERPCGIRDDGALVCTTSAGGPMTVEGDFVRGSASLIQVCVLDAEGAISCFDFMEDALSPAFSPPGNDFVDVALSHNGCALTRAGVVVCWDGEGMVPDFSAQLN